MIRVTQLKSLDDLSKVTVASDRKFHSATHDEILSGATTDVYFLRTLDILKELNLDEVIVTAEIFPRKDGILAGMDEVKNLLKGRNLEVEAIDEGETFLTKETIIRITGPYNEFAIYETTILGMLASASGWATAARRVTEACGDSYYLCFGARHVHPSVAPVMERAAVIGGAKGASCILAAELAGIMPSGTIPHSAMLIAGDTLKIAKAYNEISPKDHQRIVLIDTFKDEVEEGIRIADALGDDLFAVRVDTPSERGGVTPGLVRELRAKLDLAGHPNVKVFATGGLNPERIELLKEAGAVGFGVGSYISAASPIDMTMDIKVVAGKSIAKRGRIPGLVDNVKLKKVVL